MGPSQSKVTSKARTNSVVQAMVNNIMKCTSNTIVVQQIKIVGNYNTVSGVKTAQSINLSAKCANKAQSTTDMQTDVTNELKQIASSQSSALLGALNMQGSKVSSEIESAVAQTITNSTLTDVLNSVNTQQQLIIQGDHNLVTNIEMSQVNNMIYDACQDVLNKNELISKITNVADQKSELTQTNPISEIVDSIFSGLTTGGAIFAIVLIVFILMGGYIILNGGFLVSLFSSVDSTDSTDSVVDNVNSVDGVGNMGNVNPYYRSQQPYFTQEGIYTLNQ